MFNIQKKSQKLFAEDGGEDGLFWGSDKLDDENNDVRKEYTLRALGTRGTFSWKKYHLGSRNQGKAHISDTV